MKTIVLWAAVMVLLVGPSCTSRQHSPVGFRLPENGSVARGRTAFQELGCHGCHRVVGEDFPVPTVDPPVPVALGGTVHELRTDGYLVTAIVHPSHKLAGYPKSQVSVEGESRMPSQTQDMTVRQLVDLVAYLQSRYNYVPSHTMTP